MTQHLGRKAMIGAGLLSALVTGSFSSAASARPSRDDVRKEHKDVKEAKKDVRQERKDVRQADTPAARHQERGELRDANQTLRHQTGEYQREKAKRNGTYDRDDDHRYGSYSNDHRYGNASGYSNNGNRYGNYNNGSYGNSNVYSDNGNRYGTYNRPNSGYYNNGGSYSNNGGGSSNNGSIYDINRNRVSKEGVVTSDTRGDSFTLHTKNGQTMRVVAPSGAPRHLSRGDLVRVEGFYNGSTLRATDINIIRNR